MTRVSAVLVAAAVALVAGCPAQARSLRIVGASGYLSEWELKADVTATKLGGQEEFSGPLTLKHVGLCAPNGAVEKSGTIRFHISKSMWSSEIHATLLIDGSKCTYNAKMSDSSSGFMDCPGGSSIPLTMRMQ